MRSFGFIISLTKLPWLWVTNLPYCIDIYNNNNNNNKAFMAIYKASSFFFTVARCSYQVIINSEITQKTSPKIKLKWILQCEYYWVKKCMMKFHNIRILYFWFLFFKQKFFSFSMTHNWVKQNIFWEFFYWKTNIIRCNLDVMYIKKNMFNNIFNKVIDL